MDFKNKSVIVTGAAVGIGKATALEFARQGADVCIVDVDKTRLCLLEEEIKAMGVRGMARAVDISDEAAVKAVAEQVIAAFGKIDILVNNAAIWRVFGQFADTNSQEWMPLIQVNLLGTLYFTHAVLPNMLHNRYGRILNVGSVAGTYGNANMTVYSTTKGAVSTFTKALAKEVADKGITVNNVVPGNVRNEGAEDNPALAYMNRSGNLQEYADLICFLASDKASYISGQDYLIDGCRRKL